MTQDPVIDSPEAAARALCDYFLANADRGDHVTNDELVAELVRRIRARQAAMALRVEGNQVVARSSPGVGDCTDVG
ncbi:MAG: hypothetical protein ACRDRA_09235 [Pseudonocardiaceae bacterium]